MSISKEHKALLNGLTYPIMFTKDPTGHVDHIMAKVVDVCQDSIPDFIEAIKSGLASNDKLTDINNIRYSEEALRGVLAELKQKLEDRLAGQK